MAPRIPTEKQVLEYFNSLSNWGRWGDDDQLGTLNLITDQKRRQAAALVRGGISVGCARPILTEPAVDTPIPPLHFMIESGEGFNLPSAEGRGPRQAVFDMIGVAFHGLSVTHLDALCHVFWNGQMYGGRPAELVTTRGGASVNDIAVAQHGIQTRGVLLDITRVRGKEWLEAGEAVFVEDLEAAEAAQGVRVEEGDALCLRLGWFKRRLAHGPVARAVGRPGLHAQTLPWLRERGVSLLAADASQDVSPSGYQALDIPIHQVGIVAMGLWLIDAANFEDLAAQCQALGRWDFMFTVAALNFPTATGCPVTPLATF
jgi:kynurenine formamidase